jgi:hypothetical protein
MLNINAEAKEQGRDVNSRGWRRYFYRGIRNHARSRLILIGAPTQRGSPREGQAPRSSNSVESRGPSPRASGAPLPAPLGRSLSSPLTSFRPKRHGTRSLRYTVVAVIQTRLSRSRKTLAPLGTITTAHARAKGLCGFSKLTQLTRIHLEHALMWSN